MILEAFTVLIMGAVGSSETFVITYKTSRSHNPEDLSSNFNKYHPH
jgi:hypothetical protein